VLTGLWLVGWGHEIGRNFGHDLRMVACIVPQRLIDQYRFTGFRALAPLKPHPFDPQARVIVLTRRQKKACAALAESPPVRSTITAARWCAICPAAGCAFTCNWMCGGSTAGVAA